MLCPCYVAPLYFHISPVYTKVALECFSFLSFFFFFKQLWLFLHASKRRLRGIQLGPSATSPLGVTESLKLYL